MQDLSLDPPSSPTIACTLTAADLKNRQQAWFKVGNFMTASRTVQGGLALDFAAATGVRESLTELVRLEAECCAWMSFELTESPGAIQLAISGPGPDGERGVRESFAPLLALGGQGSVTVG